jgi:hypothetical protein
MIEFLVLLIVHGYVMPGVVAPLVRPALVEARAPACRSRLETPIDGRLLVEHLRAQHEAVFGRPSPRGRLVSAVTHIFFENGRGKAVWNHNLGNLWAPATAPHYDVWVGGQRELYASLDDFAEGARLYWNVMSRRCPRALASFDVGDLRTAAERLHGCHYYGAPVELYTRGLLGLQGAASRLVAEMEREALATQHGGKGP